MTRYGRGGSGSGRATRTSEASWRAIPQTADVLGTRAGHSATQTDARSIYVIGGRTASVSGRDFYYDDTLRLDIRTKRWERLCKSGPFSARANHTATLIGEELWLIGGHNLEEVMHDVHVLDLVTLTWKEVTHCIAGNLALLRRVAHQAVQHPADPHTILIYGGYSPANQQDDAAGGFVSAPAALNTRSRVLLELNPTGVPPAARGYHTMVVVGPRCIIVGGRAGAHQLLDGPDLVAALHVSDNRWERPECAGRAIVPCSNHAAVVLLPPGATAEGTSEVCEDPQASEACIVGYGGTAQGKSVNGQRLNQMWALRVSHSHAKGDVGGEISSRDGRGSGDSIGCKLTWVRLVGPAMEHDEGQPIETDLTRRTGHSLTWMGEALWLIGGYGGVGVKRHFFSDAYFLPFSHAKIDAAVLGSSPSKSPPATADSTRRGGAGGGAEGGSPAGWRTKRKKREEEPALDADPAPSRAARLDEEAQRTSSIPLTNNNNNNNNSNIRDNRNSNVGAALRASGSIGAGSSRKAPLPLSPSAPVEEPAYLGAQLRMFKEMYQQTLEGKEAVEQELRDKTSQLDTLRGVWETNLREAVEGKQTLVEEHKLAASAAEAKAAAASKQAHLASQQVSELQDLLKKLEAERGELTHQLHESKQEKTALELTFVQGRADFERERADAAKINDAMQKESEKLQSQVASLNSDKEKLMESLKLEKNRIEAIGELRAEEKKSLETLRRNSQKEISELSKAKEALERQVETLGSEIRAAHSKSAECAIECDGLQATIRQLEKVNRQMENELTSSREDTAKLRASSSKLKLEVQSLESKGHRLRAQFNEFLNDVACVGQ